MTVRRPHTGGECAAAACPSCGLPSASGALFPLCSACADDVPPELAADVAAALEPEPVRLVWEGETRVYLVAGSRVCSSPVCRRSVALNAAVCPHCGVTLPTANAGGLVDVHWWTVGEAEDFAGASWLMIAGGPLAPKAARS